MTMTMMIIIISNIQLNAGNSFLTVYCNLLNSI